MHLVSQSWCRQPEPALAGTATYAGGLPLPPDAVFEVTRLEVPRADAPARVIGSMLTGGPGASPITFRIPYDPDRIDTTHRYVLRARLTADRSVLYLTDQPWPVRIRGSTAEAAISLVPVTITRQLPASFTGTLPCGDCAGIHYQIDLLPDSVFYLRMIRRRTADSAMRDDIGRWTLEAGGTHLTLRGSDEQAFAPFGASVLRKLDAGGRPIVSGLEYDLRRSSGLAPLEPELLLRGLYRDAEEGAVFADCRTGRPLPVSAGGDRPALEAAYRRASAVSVTRFLGASRTERC